MGLFDFLNKKQKTPPAPTGSNNKTVHVQTLTQAQIWELGNIMAAGNTTTIYSPEVALKFSEYYNSVNKISNTIAGLSCNFYDNDVKLTAEKYPPVFHWRKMPAPGITSTKLIKSWTANYLKGGNGYVIMTRDKNLQILKYTHKEYYKITPFLFEGEPWYYDNETKEIYNWYNVLHLADLINDELVGVSKVKFYGEPLGKSKTVNEFVNKYFNAGLFLSGYVTYPPGSGPDEKDIPDLEKQLNEGYTGLDGKRTVLILTEGGEIKHFKTDIPLSDTDWLANEKTTQKNIRDAFGVPDDMSDEGKRTEYYENAVLPVIKQIESEVNTKVIEIYNQENIRFKFEVESILRADVKTKAEVIEKYLRNSIYTVNEGRALMNLPPIEGGDVPLVMANNMVPLTELEDFVKNKMK